MAKFSKGPMGENYAMVRIERPVLARLKSLQRQLSETDGQHQYYSKDWHGVPGLSLSSVIACLLDRNDDHMARSKGKRPTKADREWKEYIEEIDGME